jgi:preprotein translocase subunit SecF
MSDIDAITTDAAPDDALVHDRRSAWGRLYHGETSIDFHGRRWWGLGLSMILLLISVGSLLTRGLNLGLDFEGGVAWEVDATRVTEDQARSILDQNGIKGSDAKIQTRSNASGSVLFIQVDDQPDATRQSVQADLATAAGVDTDKVSSTAVSATWGDTITKKAVRALIVFLVLVALFIAWRLEWKMALSAIVAMLHDVLISVGVYSLFQFEVTPATVVAFLTILGFSLYDTIVVFDKVKENAERYGGTRMPFADVSNVSMNQVLMRSLNTSISAVLPVLSLLILGSEIMGAVTLREFALALLVGLITGSYSSIFIATPLLTVFKERESRYAPYTDHHATGSELERLVLGGSPAGRREHRRGSAVVAAPAGRALVADQPAALETPEALLTHPPRPRKKKRR